MDQDVDKIRFIIDDTDICLMDVPLKPLLHSSILCPHVPCARQRFVATSLWAHGAHADRPLGTAPCKAASDSQRLPRSGSEFCGTIPLPEVTQEDRNEEAAEEKAKREFLDITAWPSSPPLSFLEVSFRQAFRLRPRATDVLPHAIKYVLNRLLSLLALRQDGLLSAKNLLKPILSTFGDPAYSRLNRCVLCYSV
jgi:hypothetical protein